MGSPILPPEQGSQAAAGGSWEKGKFIPFPYGKVAGQASGLFASVTTI